MDNADGLLRPRDVAKLMACDPKTVTRWAASGKIPSVRTPGGHRRIKASVVRALMDGREPQG